MTNPTTLASAKIGLESISIVLIELPYAPAMVMITWPKKRLSITAAAGRLFAIGSSRNRHRAARRVTSAEMSGLCALNGVAALRRTSDQTPGRAVDVHCRRTDPGSDQGKAINVTNITTEFILGHLRAAIS